MIITHKIIMLIIINSNFKSKFFIKSKTKLLNFNDPIDSDFRCEKIITVIQLLFILYVFSFLIQFCSFFQNHLIISHRLLALGNNLISSF